MKKIVSFLMVFLIIVSSLFARYNQAFGYTDITNKEEKNLLDILTAYDVIKGYPDGSFRPDNRVKRSELAKIAFILGDYGISDSNGISRFSDMYDHWAREYVDVLVENKIINGYEDNTYRPELEVTYNEAILVILRLLGYNDLLLSKSSDLKIDINTAEEIGLLDGIDINEHHISRRDLIKIVCNALFLNKVNIFNDLVEYKSDKLMDNLGRKENLKITDRLAMRHGYFDMTDYLLNTGDVYFNKEGKIVCINNLKHSVIKGHITKVIDSQNIIVRDEYGNISAYDIGGVELIFNGVKSTYTSNYLKDANVVMLYEGTIKSNLVGIVVSKAISMDVVGVGEKYKRYSDKFLDVDLPLTYDVVDLSKIRVFGDVNDINEIEENDVVYFYSTLEENKNSVLAIEVVRNIQKGIYNGIISENGQDYYKVQEGKYKLSKVYESIEDFTVGDLVVVALDKNDEIVSGNILKYAKEPETYAIVYDVKTNVLSLPSVGLINENGMVKEYKLKNNCGYVEKVEKNSGISYSTSLKNGDVIKYDKFDNNTIKVANKIEVKYINSEYTKDSGIIKDVGIINKNTVIFTIENGAYKVVNINYLKDIVKGNVYVNADGYMEFFLLLENIENPAVDESKDNNNQDIISKPAVTTYTGAVYGAIKSIVEKSEFYEISFFNNEQTYKIKKGFSIDNDMYSDSFVVVNIEEDYVTKITKYNPEVRSVLTEVYSRQLQIDGISYIEYSDLVKVFLCKRNSSGKIIKFVTGSSSDIKVNAQAELYNISGNVLGIIDVIVIME